MKVKTFVVYDTQSEYLFGGLYYPDGSVVLNLEPGLAGQTMRLEDVLLMDNVESFLWTDTNKERTNNDTKTDSKYN